MNAQTETIDYPQLKQAKSLAELLGCIPDRYFEKVLLFLLGVFTLTPVIIVALLNCGITFFNPYYPLLQMGYVGIVVAGLLFYKRAQEKTGSPILIKNSKKTAIKQWVWQYGTYLCLVAVLFLGALATLFSSDIGLSFFGDYYRKEGLLTLCAYAGIFMATTAIHSEQLKKRLVEMFVLVSLFLGIIVILQSLGLPIRSVVYQFNVNDTVAFVPWTAIFHQINHYGYYLTLGILATAGLFVAETGKFRGVFWILVFSLLTGVLIKNNSFGAYLGVCAGLVLLLGVSIRRKEGFRKALILITLFIVISIVANALMGTVRTNFTVLTGDLKNIVQTITAPVQSAEPAMNQVEDEAAKAKEKVQIQANKAGTGRWKIWSESVAIIKNYPLLGKGPDNLGELFRQKHLYGDRPHNEYLQVAATMGIPAMLLYLGALGCAFVAAAKALNKMKPTGIIALGAVTAYLASAMFGNTMYYTYPYFLIFLAILLTGAQKPVGEVSHASDQRLSVLSDK
ncbi:MAG: O-antigen ligase family protein [Acetobacterium sp.]|nr:O-antigen ligase family protein [Acetobacterium sp.]